MSSNSSSKEQTNSAAPDTNVIDWDDYFMSVAILSSLRSKDRHTKVGACIVNQDKRIVGTGYNGMPDGNLSDNDNALSWDKNDKHKYVCHAEMNAILNKFESKLNGCTLYCTLQPCNECAKLIVQSRIEKVIYLDEMEDNKFEDSMTLFDNAKIEYCHRPPLKSGKIDVIGLLEQFKKDNFPREEKKPKPKCPTCNQVVKDKNKIEG